jgi:hypothetical protein
MGFNRNQPTEARDELKETGKKIEALKAEDRILISFSLSFFFFLLSSDCLFI